MGDQHDRRGRGRHAHHPAPHPRLRLPLLPPGAGGAGPAGARRPTTTFSAVLQRWRSAFDAPLYDVRIVWGRGLPGEDGVRVRLAGRPGAGEPQEVLIEVDDRLSDDEAEYAALLALATVQVAEVQAKVGRLPSARRSGRGG